MQLENWKSADIASIDTGQLEQKMLKVMGEMFVIPENQYSLQLSNPEDTYWWKKSLKSSLEKIEDTASHSWWLSVPPMMGKQDQHHVLFDVASMH